MKTTGKSAFTLLELIVVVGIIGILMGVALTQFGGSTESAKAAKCETNMRNLVTAAHTCAMEQRDGLFPPAESFSYKHFNHQKSEREYHNYRVGWISGSETRPGVSKEPIRFMPVPFNSASEITLRYALTNGCMGSMWKAMGANRTAYQCPVHAEAVRKAFKKDKSRTGIPGWSYVMNRWFGSIDFWGLSKKSSLKLNDKVRDPARLLMFAELQAISIDLPGCDEINIEARGDLKADPPAADAVLDYTKGETIGFNHMTGNRGVTGHVAFTDGHVEKIQYPRSGSELNPLALTKALCLGHEISLVKGGYKDLQSGLD